MRSRADGTLSQRSRFFDMTNAPGEDAIDGIKVDVNGNLYVSGPGGLWVISATRRSISARSSRPDTCTTWPGAMSTAAPCICAPAIAFIKSV